MTTEEKIHVFEHSKLVSDNFTQEAVAAAYVEALAALRAQAEAEKNEPLTLDELREILGGLPEITGEPIFVLYENGARQWHLLKEIGQYVIGEYVFWEDHKIDLVDDYGRTWIAYRRKPEEGVGAEFSAVDICAITGKPFSACQPGPCGSRRSNPRERKKTPD